MTMDWDNIKYVFQLPLKWFSWIDDKVRHMYGADFIRVKHDGYNDGLEVGVDYDSFANEVKKIAGVPESGWVKSVDNVGPDNTGNVTTGSIKGIDSGSQTYYPDARGIVSVPFQSTIQTVDNVGPDSGGNVQLNAVRSVNQEYFPDENGNIYLPFSGTVKSVDGIGPDSRGNVLLGALTILDLANQGAIAGPSYTGDKPVSPMSHIHNVEELAGMKDQSGNLTFIKSINTTIKPDHNGNVNINIPDMPLSTYLVASVDGIRPTDVSGNVQLSAVRSIKLNDTVYRPDKDGQVTLSAASGGISSVTVLGQKVQPVDGDVDLGAIVYSVNGIEPDEAGDVVLDIENMPGIENYSTTQQINTNINSHVEPISEALNNTTSAVYDIQKQLSGYLDSRDVETKGQIVGLGYGSERYVCNVDHGHKPDDIEGLSDNYVTIDTVQTITGLKTFLNEVQVTDESQATEVDLSYGSIRMRSSTVPMDISLQHGGKMAGLHFEGDEFKIHSGGDGGAGIQLWGIPGAIQIKANENQTVLVNPPTRDCPYENAVATIGWVKGNYLSNVVLLSGDQTIDGEKTFLQELTVGKYESAKGQYGPNFIGLNGFACTVQLGAGDVQIATIRKIQNQPLELLDGLVGVRINAPAGEATLQNAPGTSAPDNAIATVGYVKNNGGKVKTVNNVGPDSNGNISISVGDGKVKSVDNVNPDSNGNVDLKALKSTDVETRGTEVNSASTYARYVCPTAHKHRSQDVSINNFTNLYSWLDGAYAWGSVTTYKDYLVRNYGVERNLIVDGHATSYDGTNSTVSFGLAANKWLKSDANGHITYTNDTPIALPSGTSGQNTTRTVLTGLSWNGTQLVATRENWTFTNGCLTGVSTASNITINTVAYS